MLRRDLALVTGQAESDLARDWVVTGSAERSRDALVVVLVPLVSFYAPAAATLGADFYDDVRDRARVSGSFRAEPVDSVNVEALLVLARFAVGPLFRAEPDPVAALTLAQGGVQRHVANAARQTVAAASVADSRAKGWRRVGSGGGCEFCMSLIGRGELYSAATAHFEAHDGCKCTAEPVFK